MSAPLISVIVPMYKVEEYVGECLKSILDQETEGFDIEVIAVNDGSPDRSAEIARQLSKSDPRLKVINQVNGGLSSARNTGLGHAEGEYVWFVDSDDAVTGDSLLEIAQIIKNSRPEAIHLCGADVIEGEPQKLFSLQSKDNGSQNGMRMMRSGNFHGVVQYTVYKKNFLNQHNLRFKQGIYHEDTEFSPRAYYYLKDIRCIDKVLYLKRVNDNSITRTVNPKKNYDLVKVSESLREFAKTIENKQDRKYFMRLSTNALKMALTNETNLMDKETRKAFNRHLQGKPHLLKSFFQSDRAISKIEGILLTIVSGNMIFVNNHIFQNRFLRKFSR